MSFSRSFFPVLVLLFGLTGCLPYSCNRIESRRLFPADSLSRQMAAALPVDTLRLQWTTTGPEDALTHPRTVLFGADGRLYVADTERNGVFMFEGDGRFAGEIADAAFAFPYLAGQWGDTLAVFNPQARRVDYVRDGAVVGGVPLPADVPRRGGLLYVAAGPGRLFLKAIGQDFDGYVARLDAQGAVVARHPLAGPYWRHAGLLRLWGDSLLSLSGFRPVLDVLPPGGGLDTLALAGFDSPMLARSRLFMLGEIDEPPLLTASAAPAGDRLFVLNMRPGWLRVDIYDRDGRLRHVLTQEKPAFNQDYYPTDLAVRRTDDGAFEVAVVVARPAPAVALYRWRPGLISGE